MEMLSEILKMYAEEALAGLPVDIETVENNGKYAVIFREDDVHVNDRKTEDVLAGWYGGIDPEMGEKLHAHVEKYA